MLPRNKITIGKYYCSALMNVSAKTNIIKSFGLRESKLGLCVFSNNKPNDSTAVNGNCNME